MRGDVHDLRPLPGRRGHEQRERRLAIVVQSDDLPLSTLLIVPTSTSARPTIFRPEVTIDGQRTLVLAEQATAVAPEHLGRVRGRMSRADLDEIDLALRLVLGLD